MKRYRVMNQFRLRDEAGKPVETRPFYATVGSEVTLTDSVAKRLIAAKCIMPMEVAAVMAPEDRAAPPSSDQPKRRGRKPKSLRAVDPDGT